MYFVPQQKPYSCLQCLIGLVGCFSSVIYCIFSSKMFSLDGDLNERITAFIAQLKHGYVIGIYFAQILYIPYST